MSITRDEMSKLADKVQASADALQRETDPARAKAVADQLKADADALAAGVEQYTLLYPNLHGEPKRVMNEPADSRRPNHPAVDPSPNP